MKSKSVAITLHKIEIMVPISSALGANQTEVGWSIVVAFCDAPAQQRATQVCDNMVARFWPDVEFQIHWCSFDQLAEIDKAREAAAHAAGANMVIVATAVETGLPNAVKAWMEEWCRQRRGREGALIGLVEGASEDPIHEGMQQHLRNAAHHAGMDYLTHEPSCAPVMLPDDASWFNSKADELGTVLGEMLKQLRQPAA